MLYVKCPIFIGFFSNIAINLKKFIPRHWHYVLIFASKKHIQATDWLSLLKTVNSGVIALWCSSLPMLTEWPSCIRNWINIRSMNIPMLNIYCWIWFITIVKIDNVFKLLCMSSKERNQPTLNTILNNNS